MIREFLRHSLLELAKEALSSHSECFLAGRSVQWEVSNGLGVWEDSVGKKHGHLWLISGVFLVWERCQNEELAQLIAKGCGSKVIFLLKSITVVPQKHVEIVEHPQDDFCWNNLFSMSQRGPSTLTEGFSMAKLDVIRWRQPIEKSPKMRWTSGFVYPHVLSTHVCFNIAMIFLSKQQHVQLMQEIHHVVVTKWSKEV